MAQILFYLWGVIFILPQAQAHPVAFQGSTGLMGYYSKEMVELEANYSITYWMAPAVQMLRLKHNTSRPDYLLGKLNFLAFRKNGENYQANIYLHGGGGKNLRADRFVYHYGITADIEDRKLYFLSQLDGIRSSLGSEMHNWKVRMGMAPYIAPFESLHAWLILEINRKNILANNTTERINVVPTLRFFYQNVLWEIGSSLAGEIQFNHIIHF